MQNISIEITGRVGKEPILTTTREDKPMVTFSIAAEAWKDSPTRWLNVRAFDLLASRVAGSIHKGDRVMVKADDISSHTWTSQTGETRVDIDIRAYDVGLSMYFDTAQSGREARKAAAANGDSDDGLTFEEQKNREALVGTGAY